MRLLAPAALLAIVALAACAPLPGATTPPTSVATSRSPAAPASTPQPHAFASATPTPETTVETALPETGGTEFDLTTDAGLCAADAEMTNLELNDALAPLLGFPADRDARSAEQDQAIREHKNAAFLRACPERAG